jgi:hypothetical protein
MKNCCGATGVQCYTFRVFAAPQVRLPFVEAANGVLYAHGCLLNFGRASGIGLMPLSTPVSRRALRHSRVIDVQAYVREDGLWDIDARITDIKSYDATLASGPVLPAPLCMTSIYALPSIAS